MRRPNLAARRTITWCLAVIATAALVGYLVHDARQRDYQTCRETNASRAVIRAFIADASNDDPHYVKLAAKYMGPRDCEALR